MRDEPVGKDIARTFDFRFHPEKRKPVVSASIPFQLKFEIILFFQQYHEE